MESMKRDDLYMRVTGLWLWNIVRLPLLILFGVLEPVVAFACAAAAMLGLLTTIFFELVAAPHFHTGAMLAISLSFGVMLVVYEWVIRVLAYEPE